MDYMDTLSVIVREGQSDKIYDFIRSLKKSIDDAFTSEIIFIDSFDKKKKEKIRSNETDRFHIRFVECDEQNEAMALNKALAMATGEYLHITRSTCVYEQKAIKKAIDKLKSTSDCSIVTLTPYVLNAKQKIVNQLKFLKERGRIDLNKDAFLWNQCLYSMFFRKKEIDSVRFNEQLKYEYERVYYAAVFQLVHTYHLIKEQVICKSFLESDFYNYEPQYYMDWYCEELLEVSRCLLEMKCDIANNILMEFIRLQFACNLNDRNKNIITEELLGSYKQRVKGILQQLDDDTIVMCDNLDRRRNLPRFSGFVLLKIKYGDCFASTVKFDGKSFYLPMYKIEDIDNVRIDVRAMNYKGNELVVDAEFVNMYFEDNHNIKFEITVNKESYPVEFKDIYCLTKMFGETVQVGKMIQFKIPVTSAPEKIKVQLHLLYQGKSIVVPFRFTKPQARLYEVHKTSYWNYLGKIVRYNVEKKQLSITKSSKLKVAGCEVKYWYGMIRYGVTKKRAIMSVGFRIWYFLTKKKYEKENIWLTFDQLFKGGDNGEYFYRYVSELDNKNQKIYYVMNKGTTEYKNLSKKYDTVLDYNCAKHKLITLHSKIIFTTRADAILYGGFFTGTEKFFRGLFNSEIVCLQHGLSIQQIAQYQNRLFDNLKYYFCVSKYEVENISQPIYGYDDKSILKLTGAPRYDGLVSKPKKQIIITPTWRRNVTAGTNTKGSENEYSVNFKHTKYFEIYNKLINDPRVIKAAKEHGYRLIYLIHPILSPQRDDFDKNDYTEIIPGTEVNYEKILTESALMLTDHSGIQFDFAYQRKPVVYYHPDELPPQYEEGGLKYDTMGFGDVCKTHEQIVNALCRFIETDCALEDKYLERINDFFEFDDHNNCQRVYEAAVEFQKGLEQKL